MLNFLFNSSLGVVSLTNIFREPNPCKCCSSNLPIRPTPIMPIVTSDNRLPKNRCHLPLCISRLDICTDLSKVNISPTVNSATAGAGASGV